MSTPTSGRPLDEIQRGLAPRYLDRAVAALKDCVDEMERHGCPAAGQERVREIAHQLQGSLGTYGYPELTNHAIAIEQLASGRGDCGALNGALRELLERLRSERLRLESELAGGTGSGQSSATRARVLCVEDDADIAMLVSLTLRPLNLDVQVISNGAEAWEHLRGGHDYSLVLLDVSLPELTGFEILDNIRANDRLKFTPVLVLSARLEEHHLATPTDASTRLLRKPFALEDLLASSRELLAHRRAS